MMKIAICEVDEKTFEKLAELIENFSIKSGNKFQIKHFFSLENFLYDAEGNSDYDAVFPFIDGETLDKLNRIKSKFGGKIIAVADGKSFNPDWFDFEIFGYLFLPISDEKAEYWLKKLAENRGKKHLIHSKKKAISVNLDDIIFVESDNARCVWHLKSGDTVVEYKKLDEISNSLNNRRFLRVHRSYLVNMDYITFMESEIKLSSGDIIPIRQKGIRKAKAAFSEYFRVKYGE